MAYEEDCLKRNVFECEKQLRTAWTQNAKLSEIEFLAKKIIEAYSSTDKISLDTAIESMKNRLGEA